MKTSRPYQKKAVATVQRRWKKARSVLLVAPPGSGKTWMGVLITSKSSVLWVAHRRELVWQASRELQRMVGKEHVGLIMAGVAERPQARIQVASIETLIERGCPDADVVVLDEAHHYLAETYRSVVDLYPDAKFLGLTATPWRADGQPLGDIFEEIVVAAQMSELIQGGYLVDADVIRPKEYLGHDLAMDPLDAWNKYGPGSSMFAFLPRVESAAKMARRFKARGVRAETVEGRTGHRLRDTYVELFRAGLLDVLTNVDIFTEGVDIPTADAVMSCRSFRSLGAMLQAFGRALRPAPNKKRALIIDLTGATHLHGLPTEDREYSLKGRLIVPSEAVSEEPVERDDFVQEVLNADMEAVALSPSKRKFSDLKTVIVQPRVSLSEKKLKKLNAKYGKKRVMAELERLDRMGV